MRCVELHERLAEPLDLARRSAFRCSIRCSAWRSISWRRSSTRVRTSWARPFSTRSGSAFTRRGNASRTLSSCAGDEVEVAGAAEDLVERLVSAHVAVSVRSCTAATARYRANDSSGCSDSSSPTASPERGDRPRVDEVRALRTTLPAASACGLRARAASDSSSSSTSRDAALVHAASRYSRSGLRGGRRVLARPTTRTPSSTQPSHAARRRLLELASLRAHRRAPAPRSSANAEPKRAGSTAPACGISASTTRACASTASSLGSTSAACSLTTRSKPSTRLRSSGRAVEAR